MTNAMGGTHLHTPPSIFQHMIIQQGTSQQVGSWTQMPQVLPLSIPWSVPSVQQSELIRFTGEQNVTSNLHQKRKLETPDLLDIRKTKQLITEEKMAAHFQDLHISSAYHSQDPVPSTSTATTSLEKSNVGMDMETANVVDTDNLKSPRLILSEELKRIQQESILPSTLLSKLERPSMALVLWEPPSKHLRILPTRDSPTPVPNASDDNNNNNNNNNNNSDGIPDLNQTSSFEPMEL
ncbi:peroxisomal biogenesis factor 6-like isoform X2 [Vespula pensylvanica]|uniref:peroxisomal biogenesis factor 6-like isoform X2 n=1 Tax=Vespula pensylvanica TaxID=30213 RepID=UPI001CBA0700|nr:peroxisomal biogenesis factor 6-like isoform X2 [Vespula pensylvanica]